jgi:hypothetical protein
METLQTVLLAKDVDVAPDGLRGNAKMFDELLGRDEAAILDERQDRPLPV